jgi:hypothetical protein
MALIASVPRTMRTMQWAVQAAISYKRLMAGLDPDLNPEAFTSQLSRLHDMWAQVRGCWVEEGSSKLLRTLCTYCGSRVPREAAGHTCGHRCVAVGWRRGAASTMFNITVGVFVTRGHSRHNKKSGITQHMRLLWQ